MISLINIHLIKLFSQFNTIFEFKDNSLLKTTLGNTIIRYFNTTSIAINKNENYSSLNISLDCGENIIDDIVLIKRFYDVKQKFNYVGEGLKDLSAINEKNDFQNENYDYSTFLHKVDELNYKFQNCRKSNNCIIDLKSSSYYMSNLNMYYHKNLNDIFFFSCKEKNSFDEEYLHYENDMIIINLVIIIILILFYFIYKKAISRDNKEYQKKKLFINNFTLVLHNLKIISDDFNQELNDLISFLNDIIKNNMHLLFPLSNLINNGEIIDFNVFDISISNVNEKKIDLFQEIKSLQKKIDDIKNDEDSIKSKVKKNIRNAFHSMHNIVVNLAEKEENDINDDNIINDNISLESNDEETNLKRKKELRKRKLK